MLSCLSLEHKGCLDIYEFEQLPAGEYCALSYVWRGVPVPNYTDEGTFTVRGAEDGDPISIDVLRDIVWVAGEEVKEYLWMDRIGIIQSDRNDKAWQIMQMFNIYKESTCIILPGGVGRLAFSDDDTTWMDRAWTLQEALAPNRDDVIVLYSHNPSLEFEKCIAELSFIFARQKPIRPERTSIPAAYITFDDVLTVTKYSLKKPFGFNQAHAHPLLNARISGDGQLQAVWQCALTRTSSRPVDMIFSVMHFFDVLLDPKEFDDDDRLGATIELVQRISAKSKEKKATGTLKDSDFWLCAFYFMETSRQISTFAEFPETSVDGRAFIRMPNGSKKLVSDIMVERYSQYTRARVIPYFLAEKSDPGIMDDSGYYTFTARYIMPLAYVKRHPPFANYPWGLDQTGEAGWNPSQPIITADGTECRPTLTIPYSLMDTPAQLPHADGWGVYLGEHVSFDVFLLVGKHGQQGRFHKVAYFSFSRSMELSDRSHDRQAWFPYVCHKVKVCIGGPE
ncbi:hypothetical protein K435DRAFT_854512 [Dendrothele bispora CBS 962.96]|uniref:Heterokaryon incompatibility domain-containing protein n=1 Tax=Dendrothele bispora (strain CBS 962.96) TaxID=1314807 RepID=A0A4S8MF41_DENBC|nr:hypothetical protein K435DRAFT_854512 [Dendrothele bispora CBS 962.96]